MIEELIDIVELLTLLMQEENGRLSSAARYRDGSALVDAKLRLVAALEVRSAQLAREGSDWLNGLDLGTRTSLSGALERLCAVSDENRVILARQIDLSTEMMSVVAAEAKRFAGARSATYGAAGGMMHFDMPSPISINTSL